MNSDQETIMRQLALGALTQLTQSGNSILQTCKRHGWVTFDGSYWRITEGGSAALRKETVRAMNEETRAANYR